MSSARAASRWGFSLKWLSFGIRPSKMPNRYAHEYLAGVGMMQLNLKRAKAAEKQDAFTYAIITKELHESPSDEHPHITIAAATDEMRRNNKHVVIHCRTSSQKSSVAWFVGGQAFESQQDDDDDLKRAYADEGDLDVTASLIPTKQKAIPVGYGVDEKGPLWYIVGVPESSSTIRSRFYVVDKDTVAEHYLFLHPKEDKPCRAIFVGNERPDPDTELPQDPQIREAMERRTLAPSLEAVEPQINLKNPKLPVHIKLENPNGLPEIMTTAWKYWSAVDSVDRKKRVFRYQYPEKAQDRIFYAERMPVEIIKTRLGERKAADEKNQCKEKEDDNYLIEFDVNVEGRMVKFITKRKKWYAGKDRSFFVYLENRKFYMAFNLPSP